METEFRNGRLYYTAANGRKVLVDPLRLNWSVNRLLYTNNNGHKFPLEFPVQKRNRPSHPIVIGFNSPAGAGAYTPSPSKIKRKSSFGSMTNSVNLLAVLQNASLTPAQRNAIQQKLVNNLARTQNMNMIRQVLNSGKLWIGYRKRLYEMMNTRNLIRLLYSGHRDANMLSKLINRRKV